MTKEELQKMIDENYSTRQSFIDDFNARCEFEVGGLTKVVLSKQLSGKTNLSTGFVAAYVLFFKLEKK
jgi:hypothetical protein